jgi:ABC-2 type transport system permease protein
MQNKNACNKLTVTIRRTGQKESISQTVKDIYAYRHMIYSFVRRELRGRYKGSVLGFFWTFLNPLLQLCVYSIVFSTILKQGIEKYYLFLFVGLIPWIFFSSSVTGGAVAVIAEKDMVKKIYFPREVLPIARVTTNFLNMLLCFIVIFTVVIVSGTRINFLAIPCLIPVWMVEYVFALGMAFFASAVTVYFRDMEHILGVIMMAWQYLTPVLYSYDIIPDEYKLLFSLNPMTPIIGAYRDILYESSVPELKMLLWAFVLGLIVLVIGWCAFSRLKRRFAEEL